MRVLRSPYALAPVLCSVAVLINCGPVALSSFRGDAPYPIVPLPWIWVWPSEDSLPGDYDVIGRIDVQAYWGEDSNTGAMLDAVRRRAREMGANGVVILNMMDPRYSYHPFSGPNRTGQALAVRIFDELAARHRTQADIEALLVAEAASEALPRPDFPMPKEVAWIASRERGAAYLLVEDCRAWHGLHPDDVQFYPDRQGVWEAGFEFSSASGCS